MSKSDEDGQQKLVNADSGRSQVKNVTVTAKNEFQRIDNFLLSQLKGVPKSKIYRIIRKGEVRVNKKRVKPETKLSLGDDVRIPPVFTSGAAAPSEVKMTDDFAAMLEQSVLYEDDTVLVVNKPSGLAVHGGSGIRVGLIEATRARYPESQFLELVHRIDRDTSGCILIAKTRPVLRFLHAQFREDRINKRYHLAVLGKWPRHKKVVEAPLKKNELKSGERFVTVHQEGKPSKTLFSVLAQSEGFSFLEAKPITGRTHQIRVHAAFSGHPIVGDDKYLPREDALAAGVEKARLMLHARSIEFSLPIKGEPERHKRVSIEAPYHKAFEDQLNKLGLSEGLKQ